MKKISKLLTVVLCVTLVAGIFTACGKKQETTATTDGKNFTYWAVMDSIAQSTLENYGDMLFFQELEKRTGVHIDFIHPIQGSTGNEAFIAMLTGDKIPDLIEYKWSDYSGGPQQAIEDGVIVALNDYMEEYAPNYYAYMEGDRNEDYRYKLEATTEDGSYYGFNVLNIGEARAFAGIYVRADLLDKWGMNVPETIDEWEALFAKAKSEGFDKPFTAGADVISFKESNFNSFNTAFNVGKSFYLENGKVVFGPFQPGYKEYVALMADWAKKGYLDTSFLTIETAKIESNMTNGTSIATWGYVGGGLGKLLSAAQANDPNYDLVACPYPVAKKGDVSQFQQVFPAADSEAIAVSATCGNIEKAIEWCDYRYSDEGTVLQLFGIEGDTYTVENIDGEDHYVYTDKILNYEASGFSSLQEAMYHYMLPCNNPGYNQHSDYLNSFYQLDRQKEAIVTWNDAYDNAVKHYLPTLNYNTEETKEITDIKEVAEAELEVALCDIIFGKASIDTYDAAIKKAKADGYDRWIEIAQDAYERYLAKK